MTRRPFDAVVASPLSRAAETGAIIADHLGLDAPTTYPGLAERSYGEAEGLTDDEVSARYPHDDIPGRESRSALLARITETLGEIAVRFDGGVVVVATHGAVIRSVVNAAAPGTADRGHTPDPERVHPLVPVGPGALPRRTRPVRRPDRRRLRRHRRLGVRVPEPLGTPGLTGDYAPTHPHTGDHPQPRVTGARCPTTEPADTAGMPPIRPTTTSTACSARRRRASPRAPAPAPGSSSAGASSSWPRSSPWCSGRSSAACRTASAGSSHGRTSRLDRF
ncbi:histidine phosphatase family protein [Curtobacterium flaccumfaciens]|nr:histidine phosphatase family protein [Curtobacterium flaccumfaciens]